MTQNPFEPWLRGWHLVPDGEAFTTQTSHLLPVLRDGVSAILKIPSAEEERRGSALMSWYAGDGAARVIEHEDGALLLERATGTRILGDMARAGEDDSATEIICRTVTRLHAPRDRPPLATLVPLPVWFRALEPTANSRGGVLAKAATTARALLATPRDVVVLHGDIHHGNILDGGARGWLAIDPKGLRGERGFDYANIFCNPDFETATASDRLRRQSKIVAEAAGLDRSRLLRWILAYAGLSASWSLESGDKPDLALTVAEIAAAELAA
jgi:streptomycin 6-kinase